MSEFMNGNERSAKIHECQAESMARYAGIELDAEQITLYSEFRMITEPGVEPLSDQKLLYLVLYPDQQEKFDSKYSHMNFEDSIEYVQHLKAA